MVPLDALPPATPFTSQVTLFCEVLVTVAMNAWLVPAAIVVVGGVTVTAIGPVRTVS